MIDNSLSTQRIKAFVLTSIMGCDWLLHWEA